MLVGMATPTTPGAILAGNIAAARVRRRLQQSDLADRMRALGWKWVRQTVGEVEGNNRRLTAAELYGLAVALEVSIPQLMAPSDPDGAVVFPNGHAIHSFSVERLAGRGRNDHAVQWPDGGNSPAFFRYTERPEGLEGAESDDDHGT
jgi:transcriptional regulator with XRE-family HTH domain